MRKKEVDLVLQPITLMPFQSCNGSVIKVINGVLLQESSKITLGVQFVQETQLWSKTRTSKSNSILLIRIRKDSADRLK